MSRQTLEALLEGVQKDLENNRKTEADAVAHRYKLEGAIETLQHLISQLPAEPTSEDASQQ